MPAGPVGMLLGAEIREESLDDMRDPNINGTIRWTGGAGFHYVSNIANSILPLILLVKEPLPPLC